MTTRPHTPDDIPVEIVDIIEQVRKWKQALTTEFGPSRSMRPEISMFGTEGFIGDIELVQSLDRYDWMGVSLALCGMVMAFDLRYLAFYTEALAITADIIGERNEDGTIPAPSLGELEKKMHPTSGDTPEEAWLHGDDDVVQSVLVVIADTVGGRTWSVTMPFNYELGNIVNWHSFTEGANQGPDFRSIIYGTMLLPSVVRSQYDHLLIRPQPMEAIEFLFGQGVGLSVTDDSEMSQTLREIGANVITFEDIAAIHAEQEDLITKELSDLPDAPPASWFDES